MAEKKVVVIDEKSYGDIQISQVENNKTKKFYFQKQDQIKKENPKSVVRMPFKKRFMQWMQTKQSYKLLAFLVIGILLVSFVIVWGFTSKTKIGAFFESDVQVFCTQIEQGASTTRSDVLNISTFENGLNHNFIDHYSCLIFTAKSSSKPIILNNLYFIVYSSKSAEYEIKITLTNPEFSEDYVLSKKVVNFKEKTSLQFNFNIKKSIADYINQTQLKIEFIAKEDSAPISIFNMQFVS